MPPLRRPESARSVVLPPRNAIVAARTDVLVVGAGSAGIGADCSVGPSCGIGTAATAGVGGGRGVGGTGAAAA